MEYFLSERHIVFNNILTHNFRIILTYFLLSPFCKTIDSLTNNKT